MSVKYLINVWAVERLACRLKWYSMTDASEWDRHWCQMIRFDDDVAANGYFPYCVRCVTDTSRAVFGSYKICKLANCSEFIQISKIYFDSEKNPRNFIGKPKVQYLSRSMLGKQSNPINKQNINFDVKPDTFSFRVTNNHHRWNWLPNRCNKTCTLNIEWAYVPLFERNTNLLFGPVRAWHASHTLQSAIALE